MLRPVSTEFRFWNFRKCGKRAGLCVFLYSCKAVRKMVWKKGRQKERKHEIKFHLRKALLCEKLKAKKAGVGFFVVVSSKKAVRKMVWKKGKQKERKKT